MPAAFSGARYRTVDFGDHQRHVIGSFGVTAVPGADIEDRIDAGHQAGTVESSGLIVVASARSKQFRHWPYPSDTGDHPDKPRD